MAPPLVKRILPVFVFICAILFKAYAQEAASNDKIVRVAILKGKNEVVLAINGKFCLAEIPGGRVLKEGKQLKARIKADGSIISLGSTKIKRHRILVKPQDQYFLVNNRRYRGDLAIVASSGGKLLLVNYINIEDYVKGIAVRETSHYWPQEALKAQVVAFRTFALYQAELNKKKEYDLTDDDSAQNYGGKQAERYRISEIVDETKSEVLSYGQKIMPAFYHSTCGGATEDASLLWNIDIPSLKGVTCSFCRDSKYYNWAQTLTKQELLAAFKKSGYKFKDIVNIKIIERDSSGRISKIEVLTGNDKIKLTGHEFRNIAGNKTIKSANFKVKNSDSGFIFQGVGWGHGVGLCQWGAYFMSKEGFNYTQILNFYYPFAEITTVQ